MFKRRKFFAAVVLCGLVLGISIAENKNSERVFGEMEKGYLAIIIDDFGYGADGTEEMLGLDVDFTAAIMPFSSKAEEDLKRVKTAGKDYMVHMPMESLTGKKAWVGDKGVFCDMTDDEIHLLVDEAMKTLEGAAGLNNHMGSAIMENERCLSAVVKAVKEKDIVFVDSKTTAKSLGKKVCDENDVIVFERDIFLDSTDDINEIKNRLRQVGEIALKEGYAVAIGHVGPEGGSITAKAIDEMKDGLENSGIEFVTISELREIYEGRRNNK
ncbi:MAG: divergent polysaccharide deacetylase family protein [Firmicutes bacterium]|nr:divergent polysaccharide deacetylase family protein [Bacillota bacterium]